MEYTRYMKEIYKKIDGYSDYSVSNLGNIKSYVQDENGKIRKQGKTTKSSYVTNWVRIGGKNGRKFYVHQLVAKHFIKNPFNKKEVNHIDNNPQNNIYTNLEWVTHQENMAHSQKNGRIRKGESSGMSKLKVEQIKDIIKKELHYKDYALKYNICGRVIHDIWAGKAWKHITQNYAK